MAIRGCSFPHIKFQMPTPTKKPSSQAEVPKHSLATVRIKRSAVQIRAYNTNKVFEDWSRGIVCYRDDCGEIICEGYDEGPRLQTFPKIWSSRDAKMVEIHQQSWAQVVDSAGGIVVAGRDDFNGFNSIF